MNKILSSIPNDFTFTISHKAIEWAIIRVEFFRSLTLNMNFSTNRNLGETVQKIFEAEQVLNHLNEESNGTSH